MIDIIVNKIEDFDSNLIEILKKLEIKNLGEEASINQWVIPVIIRYGKLIVAQKKNNDKIIAVCQLIKDWKNERVAFIYSFYVDKEFRLKGIGSKFLGKIIGILRKENLKYIELTVDPENTVAIKLYEKFGFEVTEYRKNEYGKGVDRYLMRLELC